MAEQVLNVEGMSCNHCKAAVEAAINPLKGVTAVEAAPAENTVKVQYEDDARMEDIEQAIYDAGYDVVKP